MPVEHVSSLSEFQTILRTSGSRLVVVDFHATWCGPCHAIAPFYEQLSSRYAGRARFLKVDVDAAEDVARHCSISAMPTFHMYLRAARVVEFSGADQRRLEAEIERHAPSTADVSFAGEGNRLGAHPPAADAPPNVDRDMRQTAAAAAAKRLEVTKAEKAAKEAASAAESAPVPDAAAPAPDASAPAPDASEPAPDASEPAPDASASASATASEPQNDSRLKYNEAFLKQMVDDMGFPRIRAEKALILSGNASLEAAVEWCFAHADDPDIDEPLQVVTADGDAKPKLSPEEARKKAEELFSRARAKREAEEKVQAKQRELDRIKSGKEVGVAKAKLEEESRRRAVEEKRRQKREDMLERQRVRQMLEADKARRREKFKMPGAAPAQPPPEPVKSAPPEPRASAGKIQFRLPDGSRIEGEFEAEQTMGDLISFLVDKRPDLGTHALQLSQQYPRKHYSSNDYGVSLGELKLLPRGALTVSFS